MAIDAATARRRGATRTGYVRAADDDAVHLAPAGGGGLWPETFCGLQPLHGIPHAEAETDGRRCDTCDQAAADWLGEPATQPPRSTRLPRQNRPPAVALPDPEPEPEQQQAEPEA